MGAGRHGAEARGASAGQEQDQQHGGPTPSTVDAEYVEPSATTPLRPDDKVDDLFRRSMTTGVLQRLTDRVWWVSAQNYATIFAVGDEGVLLFDPLEGLAAEIEEAIAAVTDLPVTAVVNSHSHADHIGAIENFVEDARRDGRTLRIIGSAKTVEKMELLGSAFPLPNDVVAWPDGRTDFEMLTIELHGFVWAAHTDDHAAWLIVEEGVVHSADLLNPDQPPFWHFAGNERFNFMEDNLRQVRALDWTHLSAGHGNVGYRVDIDFELAFLDDLREAVRDAMVEHPFTDFVDPAATAHTGFLANWVAAVGAAATERLRPRYGELYGFEEATPSNAEMVAFSLYEHR